MHRPQPFHRAIQMLNAIMALTSTHQGQTLAQLVADLGKYESRGHGRNTYSSTRRAALGAAKHRQHMATAARRQRKAVTKNSRRNRA